MEMSRNFEWTQMWQPCDRNQPFLQHMPQEPKMAYAGLPRVREKSGKNKISPGQGIVRGILKKCQGILAI